MSWDYLKWEKDLELIWESFDKVVDEDIDTHHRVRKALEEVLHSLEDLELILAVHYSLEDELEVDL